MSIILQGGFTGGVRFFVELTDEGDVVLRTDLMEDPGAAEAALAAEALGFEPERWLERARIQMQQPAFWLMTEELLYGRPLSRWSMALVEMLEGETTLCVTEREGRPDELCDELLQLIRQVNELIEWPCDHDFLDARRFLGDEIERFEQRLFRHAAENTVNKTYVQMFLLVVRNLNHPFDEHDEFAWEELEGYYNELINDVADIVSYGRSTEEMYAEIEGIRRWFVKKAVAILEAEGVAS